MSVVLSVAGLVAVVALLGHPSDLLGLLRMDRRALGLALGLLALSLTCGGLRMALLARMAGTRVSVVRGTRAHVLGLFAAAVTPSGGGNHVAIGLALRREGMSHARAWAITVYTSVVDLFFFAWAVPVSLTGLALGDGGLAHGWVWAALPAAAVFAGLWFVLAFRLRWLTPLAVRVTAWRPLAHWRRRSVRFVRQLERATSLVTGGGYGAHALLQLLTAGLHLSGHAVFYVYATIGLDAPLRLVPTLMALVLVSVLAYVIPTPGGSGYMEVATSLLFTRRADPSLVTPAVLAWRLTMHYLALLLGPLLGGTMLARTLTRHAGGDASGEAREHRSGEIREHHPGEVREDHLGEAHEDRERAPRGNRPGDAR